MAKRKLTLADFEGANSLNMPSSSNTRGIADPAALRALAWGEDYDVDARRDAIAAAMLARQVAAPTAAAAPGFDQLTAGLGGETDYRFGGSGDYGMGAGPAPSPSQSGQSFTDMLGGKPSDFFAGQPPGPSIINPTKSFAPDEEKDTEATPDARTADQIIEGMVNAMKADMPAAPTPDTVTPAAPTAPAAPAAPTAPTTPEAVTQSGIPMDARSPSMYGDQPTPGGLPSSGNLFAGVPGFDIFGNTVTPTAPAAPTSPTGDPISPTSVQTTSFTAPTSPTGWGGAFGMPGAGGFAAGMGQVGSTAGKGASMPGGGAILGEGGKGWEGAAATPSSKGYGEQDKETDPSAPGGRTAADFDAAFDAAAAANAAANAQAGIALGIPGFDEGSGALAAQSAGRGGTMTSTTALTDPGTATMGRGGGWGGGGMLSMATTPGMSMPGGGFFGSGFQAQGKADVVAGPATTGDMGDPTGWGNQATGTPDVSLGALGFSSEGGGPGALGGGMGGGGASGALGGQGAVGAAGGAGGFGGMDTTGAVGGMSTGGTGETGAVGPGSGGIGGAGMGGAVGSPGQGDFSGGDFSGSATGGMAGPGVGMSEGAAAAAADAAAGAADAAAGTGDFGGGASDPGSGGAAP